MFNHPVPILSIFTICFKQLTMLILAMVIYCHTSYLKLYVYTFLFPQKTQSHKRIYCVIELFSGLPKKTLTWTVFEAWCSYLDIFIPLWHQLWGNLITDTFRQLNL